MTLTRSSERNALEGDENGLRIEMLSNVPEGARFQGYLLEIAEGDEHNVSVLKGSEVVCLYSVSGKASVEIDGQRASLPEAASLQTVVNSKCSVRSDGGRATVLAVVSREAPSAE
jgi:glyoxylate utilization-related uncharacterized protein